MSEIAGAMPVPDSVTVCGESTAPSVSTSVPVRAPVAVGENFTKISQMACTATLVQVFVPTEKSPVVTTLEKLRVVPPVLVTISKSCVLPVVPTFTAVVKASEVDESCAALATAFPLKFVETPDPFNRSLSDTNRKPVRVPVCVGVNVTLMVQVELAAKDVPQLLVCPNSVWLVWMEEMVSTALPVLLSVIVLAALVVFSA